MKSAVRKTIFRRQAGFTLIELLVAVTLMGIVSLGAAVATGQLLNQTSSDRDYTLAGRYAANAIYWIGRDALMAQQVSGWQNFPATPLDISWTAWDNTVNTAVYSLSGGVLTRTYTGGSGTAQTVIAQNIAAGAGQTYCTLDGVTLTVTITSSIGEGSKAVAVTRTRGIDCRPRL